MMKRAAVPRSACSAQRSRRQFHAESAESRESQKISALCVLCVKSPLRSLHPPRILRVPTDMCQAAGYVFAVFCSLVICSVAPAWAQVAAPNKAGVAMGHLHYRVRDVEANKKF